MSLKTRRGRPDSAERPLRMIMMLFSRVYHVYVNV